MLLELRAENYAVIDHAIAGFGPGLNLLTGETGAGKIHPRRRPRLLMGQKASTRHPPGSDRAVLSCVFESTQAPSSSSKPTDRHGCRPGHPPPRILADGKGRVYVNNQPATVAVLRALAPELALVHAQSETVSGFDPAQQRILLDRFGAVSTDAASDAFSRWRDIQNRLTELEHDEQDRLRLADLWSFQAVKSSPPHPKPAKTKPSKPRSAFSPMRKSSTPPPQRQQRPLR